MPERSRHKNHRLQGAGQPPPHMMYTWWIHPKRTTTTMKRIKSSTLQLERLAVLANRRTTLRQSKLSHVKTSKMQNTKECLLQQKTQVVARLELLLLRKSTMRTLPSHRLHLVVDLLEFMLEFLKPLLQTVKMDRFVL